MQIQTGEVVIALNAPTMLKNKMKNSEFARSRLPEFEIVTNKSPSIEVSLIAAEEQAVNFDPENDQYAIKGDIELLSIPQLVYLFFSAAEKKREERGRYTFHGSAVSDGEGILFLGHPNSGKTACSLTMTLSFGYDFVGDDRVIITNDGTVVGGNRHIPLNEYNFDIIDLEEHGFTKPDSGEKCIARSQFGSPATTDIDKIVFPQLVDEPLGVSELNCREATFRLFQDVSRTIRTSSYVLLDWEYPYPSFDTDKLASDRFATMQSIAEEATVLEMYGQLDEIVKYINQRQN